MNRHVPVFCCTRSNKIQEVKLFLSPAFKVTCAEYLPNGENEVNIL